MRKKLCWLSLLLLCTLALHAQRDARLDPYRPWVRWWWNGNKVDTLELKRELQLLYDAGIGGVEINPIEFPSKRCDSLGIPSLKWLSDDWITAVEVTLREARRLGIGCDLLVGSGWPFGCEDLPLEHRAQVMLVYATEIDWSNPKTNNPFVITKQQIFDAVDPIVTEPNADRQFELVDLFLVPDTVRNIHQRYNLIIPEEDSIVISPIAQLATDWKPSPNGRYMLYALVHCTSFASVINGAPGASGPILDHMNRNAVRQFLERMSRKMEKRLGPMRNWLRAYFVDSMELEGANWTSDFAAEFRQRRGYDLMPWLPFTMFKTGRLGEVISYEYGAVLSPDFKKQVEQVRYDFELTKAELLHERYTLTFLNWCHEQGVKARAQAYGRGFFPLESSLGYDIPEGESWTTNYLRHRVGEEMGDEDYRRGRAYTMINKYVSSAAHQTGKRIVSAEEMTNTYRLFETTLELLKVGSDMSAISGITHSVWHGFNYSPPEAGFPGWVQYGSYLNEQNSWWPYFKLLNEYRARMSSILQNSVMQTNIAIVLPTDRMWSQIGVQTEPFPNYPIGSIYEIPQLLWESIHKNGGNCDFISPWQYSKRNMLGEKSYDVLLKIEDSCLVVEDLRTKTPVVNRVPYPADKRYLEWYAFLQNKLMLPHDVTFQNPDRFMLQNHYKTVTPATIIPLADDSTDCWTLKPGTDCYLFVNANIAPFKSYGRYISFPKEITRRHQAWLYDCNTGRRHPVFPDSDGRYLLSLSEAESCFIVFDGPKIKQKKLKNRIDCDERYPYPPLKRWTLALHHAIEQWDTVMNLDTLIDLRNSPFAGFSGSMVYTTVVTLDSSQRSTGSHTMRLPTRDICQININGIDCGTVWFGNRDIHIPAGVFRIGDNIIKIKVTTTLNNYVHTLTDNKVVQHFVLKRNIPTTPAGFVGNVILW
ncbi:MAG: glycoside hydrolase family 2 [Bacteroidales bacterium]|nr:glycoside hydrolase family 2 [Bacteroidales bacterium]